MADRATYHIAIPGALREFVDYKVEQGGFDSVSEYLRALIRIDERMDLTGMTGCHFGEDGKLRRHRGRPPAIPRKVSGV